MILMNPFFLHQEYNQRLTGTEKAQEFILQHPSLFQTKTINLLMMIKINL